MTVASRLLPKMRLAESHHASARLAIAVAGLLGAGIFLRVCHSAGFKGVGFDEALYDAYLRLLIAKGLWSYPDIADAYVAQQSALPSAILPPTRFLYIFCAYLWHLLFGTAARGSLFAISCLFSVLTLPVAALFARRLGGVRAGLGVLALMVCSPLQIHMSQHALIDGFFAFWALLALWALWENLQVPDSALWQGVYTGALALMVLTKENAFFVYVALLGVLAVNSKLGFGRATPRLLLLTVLGPLVGVVVLIFLAGGLGTLIEVYRLLVVKAGSLTYAIQTGDGSWYRYLVDLLLISPLVLLLAVGALCLTGRTEKAVWFLFGFIFFSYALMANVRYGMNLRYATIWDMPLRFLALAPLGRWTSFGFGGEPRRAGWLFAAAVGLLCAFDLRQYWIFFVQHNLYELITEGLLRALKILK